MNKSFKEILEQLFPFLLLGTAIALVVGVFIMFSYVLVWGIVIGGILWVIYAIKNALFPGPSVSEDNKKKGRIIEHDENE